MNELKPCVAMRENQRLLTLAVTTAATAQPTRPSSSDLGMAQTINTVRINLLNWCNLASISKNIVFYVFLAVKIC